jgi:hypothetical protein
MSTPTNQQTDPEQLRQQIEDIRRELHKTVAQLASRPEPARAVAPQPDTDASRRQLLLAVAGALAVGFVVGRRSA